MVLKDLMEEKQLNFNQPLLSVRRGCASSATAPVENERNAYNFRPSLPPLPYYKSDLKSGPIRNPGVVPFKWECMPGRPKDENNAQKDVMKSRPLAPKLPPGRIANHMHKQTDDVLKDSPTSSSRYRAEINSSHSLEGSSPEKFLSEVEESEKEKEDNDVSSSEDENVTYVDARETLSRSESFINCSVSGVSGLEGPGSSGVLADPQTRDFMMDRFLPAAKAVASETPAFASRRHPVAREQEKAITQVIKLKQSPKLLAIPDTLPNKINGKEEEEDEEYDSDEPEDLSVKLCGLMPRFCMLNPIPGMKGHVQVASSVRSVRTKPAYSQACRDNKYRDGTRSIRGDLKRSAHQHTPSPLNESFMNSHVGRYGKARHKNVSPQMFLDKEKQLLGLPGEPRNSSNLLKNGCTKLELAANKDVEQITGLVKSTEEKTLYVDSERTRHSNSTSSESRGSNPSVDYSLQETQSLCFADEKALPQTLSSETTNHNAFYTSEKSFHVFKVSTSEKSLHDVKEGVNKPQKHDDVNIIVGIEKPLKLGVKSIELSKNGSSALALTPFLPKSPSESWLSRTLPSLSSRNPSSKSYLPNHAFRASPVDPKRERLLTPNLQNMLFLPAGELEPIYEN